MAVSLILWLEMHFVDVHWLIRMRFKKSFKVQIGVLSTVFPQFPLHGLLQLAAMGISRSCTNHSGSNSNYPFWP